MGKIASRRPLLLRFKWARAIAVVVGSCLTCVLLLAGSVHALDPNKRLTQYMHTSWRIQDGSLPAGMYAITQTSDGFLWFLSLPGRYLQIRRRSVSPMAFACRLFRSAAIVNVFADHAGGLWVLGAVRSFT